jgi:anti-sigma B factor antagonist
MDDKIAIEMTSKGQVAVAAFRSANVSNTDEIMAVAKEVREFVEKNQPHRMVFDFGVVKFFSSQVLGMLLDIRARLEKYDGEVVISAIEPQLHRVFKITNLDKIFKFFPDRDSAVKALSGN